MLLLSLFFIVLWKTNSFPFVIFPCSLLIREQSMLSWKMWTILCRQWVLILIRIYFFSPRQQFYLGNCEEQLPEKTCWPTDGLKTVSWLMADSWPSLSRCLANSQLIVGWQVHSGSYSSQLTLIFVNIFVATHLFLTYPG